MEKFNKIWFLTINAHAGVSHTFLFSIAFMFLTFRSTTKLGIITIVFSLACGVGRIYCGVHWPYDIIASILVSLFVVSIISSFKNKFYLINILVISLWYKIFPRRLKNVY